jgi:N-acetylmuramoyl-L-alanine amidase
MLSDLTWLEHSESIMTLARLMKAEAEGEPLEGQLEVCKVVLARVNDERWPSSIMEVVHQPLQFSCLNRKDPRRPVFFGSISNDFKALARYFLDVCYGNDVFAWPNHYHAASVNPGWADPERRTACIGNHIFYRL